MRMNSLFDLTGQVALLTGATHGLGMAMAKGLGKAGATLVINGNTPAKMEKALESYRQDGLEAQGFLFDVTDEAQAKAYAKLARRVPRSASRRRRCAFGCARYGYGFVTVPSRLRRLPQL